MAETASRALYLIDVGAKVVAAIAIPVATVFIDFRLKQQTSAIEAQKDAFEQSIKTREKDVELLLKFYEIIGQKRFECFDESTTALLKVYVEGNNKYSQIKFNFPELASSLAKSSLGNTSCKVNQDAALVKSADKDGKVPVATSSTAAQYAARPEDRATNTEVKAASVKVQEALGRAPSQVGGTPRSEVAREAAVGASPQSDGADGWVAVGRYNEDGGFTNFAVAGGYKTRIDANGTLLQDSIIKSRWVVYLRLSNADTVLGSNPILGVVSEGTCAKVLKAIPELRGQTWASVDIQDTCPAGVYK